MKERIQKKANDLFRKYGVKSITMDEIAGQLGVSKKTIYQFYSDKDELVESVVSSVIMFAQEKCDVNAEHSKDAIGELFEAMDFIQEIFSDMNPSMIHDLEKFHPSSYKIFLDHKNKYLYQVIRNNLHRGIKEELYRANINIDVVARFRLEGMMLAFNQEIFPANRFNLVEIQQTIIELFLFGVATMKGYKQILKYQQERIKS